MALSHRAYNLVRAKEQDMSLKLFRANGSSDRHLMREEIPENLGPRITELTEHG